MTYDAFETSDETGEPIELYRFIQGGSEFYYTSTEDSVVVDGITYTPESLKRSAVRGGAESRRNQIDITVPGVNAFATQYLASVPGEKAKLTISRVHRSDFPAPEVQQIFAGRVRSVAFTKNGKQAKIAVQPTVANARVIPRYTYMGMCNNVLFDEHCKVDDTDATWRLNNGLVTAVSGSVITVTGANGYTDGWFTAGFVEFNNGDDHRMILDHTGNDLTLLLPFPTDITGSQVDVLAGCAHDPTTCDTKFNTPEDVSSNLINYGGFWEVPTNNPFSKGLL